MLRGGGIPVRRSCTCWWTSVVWDATRKRVSVVGCLAMYQHYSVSVERQVLSCSPYVYIYMYIVYIYVYVHVHFASVK